jgi:hypothetical protein
MIAQYERKIARCEGKLEALESSASGKKAELERFKLELQEKYGVEDLRRVVNQRDESIELMKRKMTRYQNNQKLKLKNEASSSGTSSSSEDVPQTDHVLTEKELIRKQHEERLGSMSDKKRNTLLLQSGGALKMVQQGNPKGFNNSLFAKFRVPTKTTQST